MTANSVPTAKPCVSPYLHSYPKFAPKVAAGQTAPTLDAMDAHPSTQKGVKLPTEGFRSGAEHLTPATQSLMRQGEVLKGQIGAGRHALQYVAVGSAALGLAVACAGHPLAGFAVVAIGTLVGFGVQAYVRNRALKKIGANGLTGEQFKAAFEKMLTEQQGVINHPALETSRKMYDFLTRSTWGDCKHDLVQPSKRAAIGVARLGRTALRKVFNAKPPVNKSLEVSSQSDDEASQNARINAYSRDRLR